MTSERQIAANRRNAARSTGPTTAAGKGRSSRNALRHGLSQPAARTSQVANEIDTLVRELVGDAASPNELDLAREAAERQIEILRVRRERQRLIEAVITHVSGVYVGRGKHVSPAAIDRLERYERRAESRRNKALAQLVRPAELTS
jgi:hypothetical protein